MAAPSAWANGPVSTLEQAPPPISGGTLQLSADGKTLIAADPDRDAVYLVDVASRTLQRRIALEPRDEPGRVIQDAKGRVHVALRGGRSIASFDLSGNAAPRRSRVCDLPRGLAYDAKSDRVLVACNEGMLVRVDAATGRAEDKVELGRDLRDVIAREDGLYVSRFRSAELIALDPNDGRVTEVRTPPMGVRTEVVFVDRSDELPQDSCGQFVVPEEREVKSPPDVAWRTIDLQSEGIAMVHQRATEGEVKVSSGGYGGGGSCGPGVVRGSITVMRRGEQSTFDIGMPGVFVDVAYEPTNGVLAVANPGSWGSGAGVMLFTNPNGGQDPGAPSVGGFPFRMEGCQSPTRTFVTSGQATAVTFVSPTLLAVQEREPAQLRFIQLGLQLDPAQPNEQVIVLDESSRHDTGHAIFHTLASAGIACVSCHAEAGDDGHVWTFEDIGPRRTQTLRGGILGTEPFHWDGDMNDFDMLMDEVFTGRMGGFKAHAGQSVALAHWIDRQPRLQVSASDDAAVERGRELFESAAVGCASCHTGPHFTNNQWADVGTGAVLQVPALQGISFRAPFMHDGCAATLRDRFAACGGGDKHGKTSHLNDEQLADLTAYLETL